MGSTIRTGRFGRDAEELRATRDAEREADEIARDSWDDPAWHVEFHQDLVETIWYGFMHENLLELMTTVENAEEFEQITVEVVEGVEVYWVSQGSQIDASVITSKVWPLQPAFVGYHITENEDQIRSGFSRYIRKLVPAAVTQMDASINSRLLRTLRASLTANSYYTSDAGFNLDHLNTQLEQVEDESSGWPEDTGELSIVGRTPMITALMNAIKEDNTFAPTVQEDILRLGVLGTYRGAKIVKLRNYKDRNRVSYFPGNELIVTSTAASKVGFWDGMKSREWTEEGGEYWHNWGKRKVGFAVHHPEFARLYKDTTKSAA